MTPPQKKTAVKADVCGFDGGAGRVTLSALTAEIVKNATGERAKWFDGTRLQSETNDARVGDLVRYWLARHGDVEPHTLVAAESAALDSSVKYAPLLAAIEDAAVKKQLTADQKVDAKTGELFKRSDDVDTASRAVDAARPKVKPARDAATNAATAADKALAKVKDLEKSRTASVATLKGARDAASLAVAERTRKKKEHEEVADVLEKAKETLKKAERDRDAASAAYATAREVRDGKKDRRGTVIKPGTDVAATKAGVDATKKVVGDLRAVARPTGVPFISDSKAKSAVLEAHQSRAEVSAWSAVFVVWCVRAAAIAKQLEWMDGKVHKGKNALLLATRRHADYITAAHDERRGTTGKYIAFEPDARPVREGDIIATDRVVEIKAPVKLTALMRRELHCDIVTRVDLVGRYAETVGGNVGDSVRKRRYPLEASGHLVLEKKWLYAEEKDDGTFLAFEVLQETATILPSRSTRRIFAVLSLVEKCAPAADKEAESPWTRHQPTPWRAPLASQRFMPQELEQFESPFLNEDAASYEALASESPWRALTGSERLMSNTYEHLESPFLDEEIVVAERRTSDDDEAEAGAWEVEEDFAAASDDGASYESPANEFTDKADELSDESAVLDGEAEPDLESDFEGDFETALESDLEADEEIDLEGEWDDLASAATPDDAVSQMPFAPAIRARLERLLDAKRALGASKWNAARHPAKSGVDIATLLSRLERYVDRAAVERAMQGSAELRDLAADQSAVLAVVAHQFQQKIYAAPPAAKPGATAASDLRDGQVGEGTLDALGFVRHRDSSLNRVDGLNVDYHVKKNSGAYQRVKETYRTDRAAFDALGADVTPKNWYYLFVNAPFLGRPFQKGVHLELIRRLRLAERWLFDRPQYRSMSPAEVGVALGIDEDHHGGRTKPTNSMHTLGLAVDIGYSANPWVAGQHGNDGTPNVGRNAIFADVTRHANLLLAGIDEGITARWLSTLGNDPGRTTDTAYTEIRQRHDQLVEYFGLGASLDRLRAVIEERRRAGGPNVGRVIARGQTVNAAVARWRRRIAADRARLGGALGRQHPERGFLNLHRDLVIALRDHGCLAWGAIDLGARACGDMMHFDCRPSGLGWALSLPRQRTAGANHPCVADGAARVAQEYERPSASGTLAAPTPLLGGQLWTFIAKALPLRIGVFVPQAVGARPKTVEFLVFGHGHLDPCPPVPTKMPQDLITNAPFRLAKHVDASNRAIVLVVPSLEWGKTVSGKLGFGQRGKQHLLGMPANFNAVIAETLQEIGRVIGAPAPTLSNLVVAGHSRAFDLLDPLAAAHADAEMSKGALARLTRVWALDTTYTAPVADYTAWLAAKPALEIDVFFRCGTGTMNGGLAFERAAPKSGGRLRAGCVCEGHCAVPGRRLPELLARPNANAPNAPAGGVTRELDDDEAFYDAGEELLPNDGDVVLDALEAADDEREDELEDEGDDGEEYEDDDDESEGEEWGGLGRLADFEETLPELNQYESSGTPAKTPALPPAPRPKPTPAVDQTSKARAEALIVLTHIKQEAQSRAKTVRSVGTASRFYKRLRSFYLKDYLKRPSPAAGKQAAVDKIGKAFAGPATPGDEWEKHALDFWNKQPIPDFARRLRPRLPAELAAATGILSRANRKELSFIDVPHLVGEANMGTGFDADVAGGGKNISQLMHWATGVKYSDLDKQTLRELFLAYELWHLEAWDVFGEDPVNDFIAEEAGRILGTQLRVGSISKTNLVSQLNLGFGEARAWVGSLLRERRTEFDGWILAEKQEKANMWWGAQPPMDVWGSDTIFSKLKAGQSVDAVKKTSLVERIIGIYTLIFEAGEWESKGGKINNGDFIGIMLLGQLNTVFRKLAKGEPVTSANMWNPGP